MDTIRTKSETSAGLNANGREVYETLLQVRAERITHKKAPPNVVVITDLAKDLDDLLAMIVLEALHDLGLIKVVGFIANLKPAQQRARFGRGALDSLGRRDIPIAWGEEATTKSRPVHPYEFDCDFMADNVVFTPYGQPKSDPENSSEIESGISLLDRLVKIRVETPDGRPRHTEQEEKLTFLLISSLADIWTFAKLQPENFVKVASRIVLQGGYTVEPNLPKSSYTLIADPKANNNGGFDINSANHFHDFICREKIPSVVYTKVAATASAMPTKVLKDMAATGHILGEHLYKIHSEIETKYYEDSGDLEKRFQEHMDEKWFLETRTNWFLTHAENDPYPKGADILEYILVIPYDALAALEAAGPDVRDALNVLKPFKDQNIHKIVGRRTPNPRTNDPGDIGVNIEQMQMVLEALWMGSLMSIPERRSSRYDSKLEAPNI